MIRDKQVILIAGGTGFIGKHLINLLNKDFEVRVLTRNKSKLINQNYFYWNPELNEIDENAIIEVEIIINLCGEGVADKRWTKKRKELLLNSRTKPAEFLYSKFKESKTLKQYVTASGINCYPTNLKKTFIEEDEYGADFVSEIVKNWEKSADLFLTLCKVCKLRIGFVIANEQGGINKITKPIKLGFGSYLGTGEQKLPWIHLNDLIRLFKHTIDNTLEGSYNAIAGVTTNKEITDVLAVKYKKKLFLPNVPSFVLKIILGELATLLLTGVDVSNKKILQTGFIFEKSQIQQACLE
jgi:uncharacterized protein